MLRHDLEESMDAVMKTKLPANFRRIRLELAREPGHPAGDRDIGYVLIAPLDEGGRLDPDTARSFKDACTIVRRRDDEEPVRGWLRRRPGGSWAFHYEFENGAEDEDPGYRLGDHIWAPGEYVTIQEDEGAHTYRVISVQPL
jgi:hypothetical protein